MFPRVQVDISTVIFGYVIKFGKLGEAKIVYGNYKHKSKLIDPFKLYKII